MGDLNKVQLIGRLGKDPEVRRLNNGNQVVSFSLATSDQWRDKASGDRKQATEWHNIVIFNEPLGKIVEQYTKKGSRLYVEGKLKTRKWQDKDGNDRYSTEVVLEGFGGAIQLLDQKDDNDDRGSSRSSRDDDRRDSRRDDDRRREDDSRSSRRAPIDDDIPF